MLTCLSPGSPRKMPTCTSLTGSEAYVAQNYRLLAVDKSSLNPMSNNAKDSTSPPLSTWNIYVYKRKQLAN